MIASFVQLALRLGAPARIARPLAWVAIVAIAVGIAGLVVWRIHAAGADAGAATVAARVERRDAGRRAEVRVDERDAQTVAGAIGADVAARTDAATGRHHTTIEEIRDAVRTLPPARAGAVPPPAPVERLRDAINRGTERANRAAADADAGR